jgi:hypothetical protein
MGKRLTQRREGAKDAKKKKECSRKGAKDAKKKKCSRQDAKNAK